MLILVRKILSNFLFKILLLFVFVMAVFNFGNGHFKFVTAFSDQINILPEAFYTDTSTSAPFWHGLENSLYQDLSAQASFADFSISNSATLTWDEASLISSDTVQDEVEVDIDIVDQDGADEGVGEPTIDNGQDQDQDQGDEDETSDSSQIDTENTPSRLGNGIEGAEDSAETPTAPVEVEESINEKQAVDSSDFPKEDTPSKGEEDTIIEDEAEEDIVIEEQGAEDPLPQDPEIAPIQDDSDDKESVSIFAPSKRPGNGFWEKFFNR